MLDIKIEKIKYIEVQKPIDVSVYAKSVRLDVYVKDDRHTIYNVEMQTSDTRELPKRSRFYQGIMDVNLISKGEYYKKLNESYVIFICTFDLFHKDRYRYTFKNVCTEDNSILLEDKTTKIFFNTKGVHGNISKELKSFFDYVEGNKCEAAFVKKLEQEIDKIKENDEWRQEYMTLLLRDQENIEQGREQGREQGKELERLSQVARLIKKGKAIEMITDFLGYDRGYVEKVKQLVEAYPDLDAEALFDILQDVDD
jgi:predicted transposase/invertase (TIGR01784 family)